MTSHFEDALVVFQSVLDDVKGKWEKEVEKAAEKDRLIALKTDEIDGLQSQRERELQAMNTAQQLADATMEQLNREMLALREHAHELDGLVQQHVEELRRKGEEVSGLARMVEDGSTEQQRLSEKIGDLEREVALLQDKSKEQDLLVKQKATEISDLQAVGQKAERLEREVEEWARLVKSVLQKESESKQHSLQLECSNRELEDMRCKAERTVLELLARIDELVASEDELHNQIESTNTSLAQLAVRFTESERNFAEVQQKKVEIEKQLGTQTEALNQRNTAVNVLIDERDRHTAKLEEQNAVIQRMAQLLEDGSVEQRRISAHAGVLERRNVELERMVTLLQRNEAEQDRSIALKTAEIDDLRIMHERQVRALTSETHWLEERNRMMGEQEMEIMGKAMRDQDNLALSRDPVIRELKEQIQSLERALKQEYRRRVKEMGLSPSLIDPALQQLGACAGVNAVVAWIVEAST